METTMPSHLDDSDTHDAGDTRPRIRPQAWRERHALKLLGGVMVAMFATVIIAQVAC
jgi:hypothetical protein